MLHENDKDWTILAVGNFPKDFENYEFQYQSTYGGWYSATDWEYLEKHGKMSEFAVKGAYKYRFRRKQNEWKELTRENVPAELQNGDYEVQYCSHSSKTPAWETSFLTQQYVALKYVLSYIDGKLDYRFRKKM